jgi:hypothetical protein
MKPMATPVIPIFPQSKRSALVVPGGAVKLQEPDPKMVVCLLWLASATTIEVEFGKN